MSVVTKQNISLLFYFICLILALALAFSSISEYVENDEVAEISFQVFDSHKNGNHYPSISVCIVDPYEDLELRKYNDSIISADSYSKFLTGKYRNNHLFTISYDSVTIDIRDYIIGTCIFTTRGCQNFASIKHFTFLGDPGVMKCFTFEHETSYPIIDAYIAFNQIAFKEFFNAKGAGGY